MAKENDGRGPRIRVVNDSGVGHATRVFDGDGNELNLNITEIDLHLAVGEPNTATIKAILVGAAVDAAVVDFQTKVLPPPEPKAQLRFRISEGSATVNRWSLVRLTPLPTFGIKEEFVCGGAVAKDVPLCEIVADEPEP